MLAAAVPVYIQPAALLVLAAMAGAVQAESIRLTVSPALPTQAAAVVGLAELVPAAWAAPAS